MDCMETPTLRRITAVSLVVFAVLSFAFVLLAPELPDARADWPAAIGETPVRSALSVHMFIWSQPAFAIGTVGLAAWLRPWSPKLATVGGVLGVISAFMHIVPGSWSLTQISMAAHPEHYAIYGQLIEAQENSPQMLPYFILGLGMVVSVLLLGIAHFRSRLPMRWAGPVLWAWLVVEFLGTGLFTWAPALSGALLVLGIGGLVAGLIRTGQLSRTSAVLPDHASV